MSKLIVFNTPNWDDVSRMLKINLIISVYNPSLNYREEIR